MNSRIPLIAGIITLVAMWWTSVFLSFKESDRPVRDQEAQPALVVSQETTITCYWDDDGDGCGDPQKSTPMVGGECPERHVLNDRDYDDALFGCVWPGPGGPE